MPKIQNDQELRDALKALDPERQRLLGARFAQDAESYQYLAESIRMFPDQEALAEMMRAAGLEQVKYQSLSGGIVAIHTGWRL